MVGELHNSIVSTDSITLSTSMEDENCVAIQLLKSTLKYLTKEAKWQGDRLIELIQQNITMKVASNSLKSLHDQYDELVKHHNFPGLHAMLDRAVQKLSQSLTKAHIPMQVAWKDHFHEKTTIAKVVNTLGAKHCDALKAKAEEISQELQKTIDGDECIQNWMSQAKDLEDDFLAMKKMFAQSLKNLDTEQYESKEAMMKQDMVDVSLEITIVMFMFEISLIKTHLSEFHWDLLFLPGMRPLQGDRADDEGEGGHRNYGVL